MGNGNTTACEYIKGSISYSNISTPGNDPGFVIAVQVVVGVTCVLSILGASLIIFTYYAYRDIRTTTRLLLVNLSVADIIISVAQLLGLFTNYDRFLRTVPEVATNDTWCQVQGGFAVFAQTAMFLWTSAIAVYLLCVVGSKCKLRSAAKLRFVFYAVCWGIPAAFAIAFGPLHFYGYTRLEDVGWCYTRGDEDTKPSIIANVLGYAIWSYPTVFILPLLYIVIQFCICKKNRKLHHPSVKWQIDAKLVLVPLIFVLLRLPGIAIEIPVFYLRELEECRFHMAVISAVLAMLDGIGGSAQGLVNGILFCLLTKAVRERILRSLGCSNCNNRRYISLVESHDEQQIISYEATTTVEDRRMTSRSIQVPLHSPFSV